MGEIVSLIADRPESTPSTASCPDQTPPRPAGRRAAVAALVVAVMALVAAACGGSSSNNQSQDTVPQGVQGDQVVEDEGTPTPGGTIKYGLEAESDGFNPTVNRWAISGVMVGLAVYDPLAAYDEKQEAKPYLAESFTPNATFTEWKVKLRSGIKFSNGTPLTAAGVKQVYDAHLKSPLTKPVFSPIDTITTTDDLTVVFTMKTPWVVFPSTLTAQTGVIPEPGSVADTTGANPIGTGPFIQTDWKKDVAWQGKKNPGYWRKDAKGVQLPYLDSLEFRPIPEYDSRGKSLESDDIQMMHSSNPKSIVHFRDLAKEKKFQIIEDNGEGEEGFIILNSAKPPFDDVNARRALAHATDTANYNDTINEGILESADGPFRKNSVWRSEFKNYPSYDLAKATDLVNTYKADHGGQAPTFTLGITKDNVDAGASLQAGWQQAGFVIDVKTSEQATFIIDAVAGKYQANLWRQFGAPDPDADLLWWVSDNAKNPETGNVEPEGGLTLNIARHASPCKDAALKKGRENPDLGVRKQAYAELQQCMADEVPYVWLDHSVWAVMASNKVRGIKNGPLPDGSKSLPIGGAGDFGGVTRLTQTWLAR